MKKILNIITVMLIMTAILCGCGNGVVVQKELERLPSTGSSWTVMIYMCGSTLEEEYASGSEVLRSLAYDLPENINVVVETGGSRVWHTDDVDFDYLQDYEVQKNGIRLVNQNPAANMGDASTLSKFLSWGIETYSADHYMAVIWDHGAGPIGGVGFDSLYEYDSLSLGEIKSALGSIGIKLDILGFDASLMSNLETASAVSLYADYMVASEDVMPSTGWDYNGLFEYLSMNPESSAPEVGKAICDGVAMRAPEGLDIVSMAVADLSQEANLSLLFDGMAGMMVSATNDLYEFRNIVTPLSMLEYMGGNSPWEGYSNMVDLAQFVKSVSPQIGDFANSIEDAINTMMVYRNSSLYHSTAGGLGIYYPRFHDGAALSRYRKVCMSNSYMEFIERVCADAEIEDRKHYPTESYLWDYYQSLVSENVITAAPDMNGRYVLTATHPELFTNTAVNFYMYDPKAASYLYLYSDYQTRYDESAGGYVYEFSGRLPELNSTPVSMYLVSSNIYYDVYSIPVVYDGEISNIRVLKSKITDNFGEYKILGIWKGVDEYSGMAQREYRKLNTGDVIIPVYRVYGQDESKYVEGRKIRIGFGGVQITEKLLSDGDYIVSYTAEDMYNQKYECATNNLEAKKGSIKIMDY